MSRGLRAFFAVLSLVLTVALLVLTVFGFVGHDNSGQHMWGVGFIGALLTVLFGFFNYHDYQYFFGKQPTPPAAK